MKNVKTNQMNACRCNSEGAGAKMTSWLNNNFKLLALTLLAVLSSSVWGEEYRMFPQNNNTFNFNWEKTSRTAYTASYAGKSHVLQMMKLNSGTYGEITTKSTISGISSISFNCVSTAANTVTVSYSSNKSSWTDLPTISVAKNAETYIDYDVNTNSLPSTAVYIRIRVSANSMYMYSVTINTGSSCTTPPTVSAGSASGATTSSLTFNCAGGITSLGSTGCSITEYGYVYGTSSDPTTSNTKYKVGTTYTTTGTAFAEYTATGLNCGTTYYMRPYAINGKGTAYGAHVSLATLACPVDHFIDNIQETSGYTGDGKAVSTSYTKISITLSDKAATTSGSCEDVHYHFVGWVTAANRSAGYVDAEHIVDFQDSGNTPTGTTYYAVWAKEAE